MDDKKLPWLIEDELDEQEETSSPVTRSAGEEILLTHLRCPACGGVGAEVVDDGFAGWSECSGCRTRFRRTRPSAGQLAAARNSLFADCFARPLHAEKRAARDQTMRAMQGYFDITRGRQVALNAFGSSALDVCSGVGLRMRMLQDYGWAAYGIEASVDACEYAHRLTLDVKQGWPKQADFGSARFDLALFCGTLGELPDAPTAIQHLRPYLSRGALACVLDEPVLTPEVIPAPAPTRVALFTPESLKKLFCDQKFSFVREEVRDGHGTFWFKAKPRR